NEVAAVTALYRSLRFLVGAHRFSRWSPFLLLALVTGCAESSADPGTRPPPNRNDGPVAAAKDAPAPEAKQSAPAARTGPVGLVGEKDLLEAAGNTENWLMYGRTYD